MRIFTDEKVELFELVSITDKYRVEGSSDIEKLIHYGDIDLLEIAKKQSDKNILEHFKHVFEEIKKFPRVVITDFKCGKKNGAALRWTYDDLVKGEKKGVSFFDALKMESTIKLDVVANLDRFLEITTVYDFGDNYVEITDDEFIKDLVNDYEKQIKSGNFYKAIKRMFLIMKITDKKNSKLIDFINYFNEPYALLYRLKSDLETTLLVVDEPKFKLIDIKNNLDNIKESLSSFPLENKMIDIKKKKKKEIGILIQSQITIVNDALNVDVKRFVQLNKL
jgi:hypothetical protein